MTSTTLDPPQEAAAAADLPMRLLQHELRTPLAAVVGGAQLILYGPDALGPHTRRWIEKIELAGLHMLQLLDSLAHDGLLTTHSDLGRIVGEAVRLLRVDALARQVQIDVALAQETRLAVAGSAVAWRQVLLNLLGNAIKYSPVGAQVRVRVEPGPGHELLLVVEDEAGGMEADELRRLCTPGERLGRDGSDAPGSGLGLYLVARLVERMQGRLEICSESGVGTRATVRVPMLADGADAL